MRNKTLESGFLCVLCAPLRLCVGFLDLTVRLRSSNPKPHPREMHAHRAHARVLAENRDAIAPHQPHDAGDRRLAAVEVGYDRHFLSDLESLRIARIVMLWRARFGRARDLDRLTGSHLGRAAM